MSLCGAQCHCIQCAWCRCVAAQGKEERLPSFVSGSENIPLPEPSAHLNTSDTPSLAPDSTAVPSSLAPDSTAVPSSLAPDSTAVPSSLAPDSTGVPSTLAPSLASDATAVQSSLAGSLAPSLGWDSDPEPPFPLAPSLSLPHMSRRSEAHRGGERYTGGAPEGAPGEGGLEGEELDTLSPIGIPRSNTVAFGSRPGGGGPQGKGEGGVKSNSKERMMRRQVSFNNVVKVYEFDEEGA